MRSLPDLIERLNNRLGFKLTTGEFLDATRLLTRLSSIGIETTPECLKNHLRPLLLKRSDETAYKFFDEIFDIWWDSSPSEAPKSENGKPGYANEIHEAVGKDQINQARRRKWFLATAVILLLLAVAGIYKFVIAPRPGNNDSSINIVAGRSATNLPGPGEQIGVINEGAPELFYVNDRTEQPFYGYWLAYRYFQALRPELAWLLVAMPFSIISFVLLPSMVLSRTQGGSGTRVLLNGWGRETAARRLVEPLPESVASHLNQHFRGSANERLQLARRPAIDMCRSVEATVHKLGIPHLRYRHAPLRPSYRVLVDADRDDALSLLWAQRLKHSGIDADIWRIDRAKGEQIPDCYPLGNHRTGMVSFVNMPNPPIGQRLILVSDGGFLVDNKGRWHDWALKARLERWPVRVLFSPREPRDFFTGRFADIDRGVRPGDPGFLVLPQEESALAAWSAWLVHGRLPPILLREAQRFPRLIAENGKERYLNDAPQGIGASEVNRLLSELNVYLGENGFYWLCCCAVPPVMDPNLTLLLGEEYLKRSGVTTEAGLRYHLQRNYRLLARLPWLRHNHIPHWLRLAFIARLSKELQQEVRNAVEGLLSRQAPNHRGDLPLDLEVPPAANRLVAKTAGVEYESRDTLYIGFMSGLSANELALRVPGGWRDWIGALYWRENRWTRFKNRLTAGFSLLLFRHGVREFGMSSKSLWLAGCCALLIGLLLVAAYVPIKNWPPAQARLMFSHLTRPLIMENSSAVLMVAFSRDGKHILSGDKDGAFRLWDADTGVELRQSLMGDGESVTSIALSTDGTRIVSGSTDGTLQLWDAVTGKAIGRSLKGHKDSVISVAFSPNGQTLASGSRDSIVILWDVATLKPLGESFAAGQDGVYNIAFSPDGQTLASGSRDGTVILWDVATLKPLGEPLAVRQEGLYSVAFSPDGQTLASGSEDGTVILWDVATRNPLGEPLVRDKSNVYSVAFSPDGQTLSSGTGDGTVILWDVATRRLLGEPLVGHKGVVYNIAFSPDGSSIVSASLDGTMRLWKSQFGIAIEPLLLGHEETIESVSVSPDGRLIASGSADKTVRIWNAETGEAVGEPLTGHQGSVLSVAFSPDDRRIVSGSQDHTLRLWNAANGKAIGLPLEGHDGSVTSVAFSPDGRRILSGSVDQTLRIWDSENGKPLGVVPLTAAVYGAAFYPEGDRIVAVGGDDSNNNGFIRRYRIPPYEPTDVAMVAGEWFERLTLLGPILSVLLIAPLWIILTNRRLKSERPPLV